jgi:hypothetical protein
MDSERTFLDLAKDLERVYGCIAASVHAEYAMYNPLKTATNDVYWEHTRKFLEHLHIVLYTKNHQLSLHKIKAESYFFLVKTCIDHAYVVTELIDIRNDRENKHTKDMANHIAHHILPPYLTYRRQTLHCSFDHNDGCGPGRISVAAQSYAPPMPQQSPMMPPVWGQMPMQTMPPVWGQMPMWPWSQPSPMVFDAKLSAPQPHNSKRLKPTIRLKPTCTKSGAEREQTRLHMPVPSDSDNVPLNFYAVYCSARISRVNNTADAEQHHVPRIFPVPNRPPPPSE